LIRPVTQALFECLILDMWPQPSAICDFGIVSQKHYAALQRPVRAGFIQIEDLEKVLGNGPAITTLVNKCPQNLHPGIIFKTPYDDMTEE